MPALLDPREGHFRIPSSHAGLSLFLRYLPPPNGTPTKGVVLYVHGATFPSALSIAHRFDGRSWRDELCARASMSGDSTFMATATRIRIPACLNRQRGVNHSAARMTPAGSWNKPRVSSASITRPSGFPSSRIPGARSSPAALPHAARSWSTGWCCSGPSHAEMARPRRAIRHGGSSRCRISGSASPRRCRQTSRPCCRAGILPNGASAIWTATRRAGTRTPPSVQTPSGPWFDIGRAWAGDLAYDPALVRAPVAIIRGEWDSMCTDADAAWLFGAFTSSPIRRDVKISRGTHLMHLETSRYALYRETQNFLAGGDAPPT